MSSRNMCLLPWATLHSDSEQQYCTVMIKYHFVRVYRFVTCTVLIPYCLVMYHFKPRIVLQRTVLWRTVV
jgi:hypothetical protein